ncbi:hypothetical protein Pcinc_044013, partial [Petrolisthes cinctipes]
SGEFASVGVDVGVVGGGVGGLTQWEERYTVDRKSSEGNTKEDICVKLTMKLHQASPNLSMLLYHVSQRSLREEEGEGEGRGGGGGMRPNRILGLGLSGVGGPGKGGVGGSETSSGSSGSGVGSSGSVVTRLVLSDARLEDSDTFLCTATNPHGTRTARYTLIVQDVPAPPSDVVVSEGGSRHITLTWTPSRDSNSPVISYIVTLQPQSPIGGLSVREERVGGQERGARVGGLTPYTHYMVRVAAENRVVAVSSTSLEVNWDSPPTNTTHGPILGYHIGYKLSSSNKAYNFSRVSSEGVLSGGGGGGVGRVRVGELRPHTRYSLVVRVYNGKGAGPPSSPPAIATTLEDKPSAPPQDVRCRQGGPDEEGGSGMRGAATTLTITWTPPSLSHRNGDLTSYRVTYWPTQQQQQQQQQSGGMGGERVVPGGVTGVGGVGLMVSLEGLQAWTNYSVSVAAFTRAGRGVASTPLTCTTAQDVPSSPALIKAMVSGPRAVVVSWSAPSHPNGPLLHYTVKWAGMGVSEGAANSKRVGPGGTHIILQDLPYTVHQVWVTAATGVGEGPPTNKVRVRPASTIPAGVWSVGGQVQAASGEGVSLRCGAVGIPQPHLAWTHQGAPLPLANSRVVMSEGGASLNIGTVQRGDSGRYTCTATNPHGRDSVTYQLTVLVPPSPPSLHATETTASSIRVQWGVTDTGGAPLLGATLHYRSGGGGVDGDVGEIGGGGRMCMDEGRGDDDGGGSGVGEREGGELVEVVVVVMVMEKEEKEEGDCR